MIENDFFTSLVLLCPLMVVAFGWGFKFLQNKKAFIGGDISTAKSFWLSYTIITWFLAPFIFFSIELHPNLKFILVLHLISFWIRGIVELFMIYKFFNWSPRYGITHSGFHGLMVAGLMTFAFPMDLTHSNIVTVIFLSTVVVTATFETAFATLFFKVRSLDTGPNTHKIYFANDEDKWRKINKLTELALFLGFLGYALILGSFLIVD